MATFRVISSPKVGLICVVVFLVVYVLSLLNKYHSVDNERLVSDSTYFYYGKRNGQGWNISSQRVSLRKIVPNAAPLYTDDNVTAAKFWKIIDGMITNDSLYSEDVHVPLVVNVLRHAKIIKADLFLERTSYKWNLLLQGGQRILFKPKIV